MTLVCGDSHTSTHGALGALAFGLGNPQVRDVLASQCLAHDPLKVRRIDVTGRLQPGVYAKDVILTSIRVLGVHGGAGYAYEYGGDTIARMSIDERMTVCNMSIEGGARVGYVNPDDTTFEFLRGRPFAPAGEAFDRAVAWWRQLASDPGARYDDRVALDASSIEPTVTWGINPGQSVGIKEAIPQVESFPKDEQAGVKEALDFMDLQAGQSMEGVRIDDIAAGESSGQRSGLGSPVSTRSTDPRLSFTTAGGLFPAAISCSTAKFASQCSRSPRILSVALNAPRRAAASKAACAKPGTTKPGAPAFKPAKGPGSGAPATTSRPASSSGV